MKKLIWWVILTLLFVTPALAMGNKGHNKDHHSQQVALIQDTTGPVIRAFSENAALFIIDILDVAYIVEAEEDGYLEFDLFPLKIPNGKYRVKITPTNIVGEAPSVEFDLQITGGKTQLWKIIPIQKLLNTDPEYLKCFSEDLSVYILK